MNNQKNISFMKEAIESANEGLLRKSGGPFGAVIVKDNKVIGKGYNKVIEDNDPSAHAEIVAIRNACSTIKSFDLTGAELYTTCFPCPMCATAILWSRLTKVHYCLTSEDAAKIGFDDKCFYNKMGDKKFWKDFAIKDDKHLKDCVELFSAWFNDETKTMY